MKSAIAILILVILSVFAILSLPVHASPKVDMCYQINDIDMRQSCIAHINQDKAVCYHIQDSTTRLICLAQIQSERTLLAYTDSSKE